MASFFSAVEGSKESKKEEERGEQGRKKEESLVWLLVSLSSLLEKDGVKRKRSRLIGRTERKEKEEKKRREEADERENDV